MKVVFVGTVEFSKKILECLIDIKAEIAGVVTKEFSKFNSDFADLTPLCKENTIPYHYTKDINSPETISWIKDLSADVIFCFGWSSLIKKELLNLCPLGIIGFHPAKLPQNRGRHPLIWALALGLKESASTFFFMDEGADSGDILSQEVFEITHDDDAFTLYNKVVEIAKKQVSKFYFDLKNGTYKRIPQNHNLANTWKKRNQIDGIIDFKMNSETIYNLTRALTGPYIGAEIKYKDKNIKIWKTEITKCDLDNIEYGKIINVKNNIITVKTPDGAINLVEHEFDTLPSIGEYL